MFRALGIKSTPKGGFGNRLLNYINLRELSTELGVRFFGPNRADAKWVNNIHRPVRLPWALRDVYAVSRSEVVKPGFTGQAHELLGRGKTLLFKPRLLTEALARFDFVPPAQLVDHRFRICETHRRRGPDVVPIVIHLRGTDFAQWKPGAVLPASYYSNALDFLDSDGFSTSAVRICTDDANHPALEPLAKRLASENRLVSRDGCDDSFSCDFAALIHAHRVISSPSTFAVTAGFLGSGAALHSRDWVDARIDDGDLFWSRVRENSLNGYVVDAEI